MIGSFLPAFLWGVAMANLVRGVPIDQAMNYVGTLSTLLNPFALWSGLTMVTVFLTHGAYFLAMKTDGSVQKRSTAVARPLARIAFVVTALFLYWADRLPTFHPAPTAVVVGLGAWAAMVAAAIWSGRGARRGPFFLHGFAIMLITAGGFIALFPRLMISSLNPAWTLTIYNAASNPYTLQVMSWVALTLVPVVLAYQVWTYWLFRKRTSVQSSMEY
jgi:cytochrome d ubiquinol oxidase subunit II